MLDYINTNTFRDFADYVIMLNNNKPFTTDILKQDAIIYCKTDYLNHLFSNLTFAGRKYILITHASDFPIDQKTFLNKPNCIKKWYAENAKYNHPDLISIPIGLTPNKGPDESPLDLNWFINNIKRLKSTSKNIEILYCNWTNNNNPRQRINIIQKLQQNNIKYLWDYPIFTEEIKQLIQEKVKLLKEKKSSKQEISKLLKYYDYCENMSYYKFIIAPPGNGEDTHRVWEALYMGAFPIVLKSNIFKDYADDLPIIQVNDYSEVTYDLLYSYLNKKYNYEKLYMLYWKKRINNEIYKI